MWGIQADYEWDCWWWGLVCGRDRFYTYWLDDGLYFTSAAGDGSRLTSVPLTLGLRVALNAEPRDAGDEAGIASTQDSTWLLGVM